MSRSKKKKHTKKFRWIVAGTVAAGLITGVLVFWNLFYIRDVEVVGNTRYTSEEIREMAMGGFLEQNSVYLSVFRSHIDMDDVAFLDFIDVEYLGRDKIRLIVTEKNPVGYVSLDGMNYYFDKDGVVLEAVSENGLAEPGGTGLAGNTQTSDGTPAPETTEIPEATPETPGNAVDPQPATGSEEPEEEAEGGEATPSLSDLPLVTGLECKAAAVGEKLSVADDSVFNTILALNRMIEKYSIQPDSVEFAENLAVILHYGNVRIYLGADSSLEEKMIRVAAILPKLEGKSGVLHLEDYTEDTQNIVFTEDAEQSGES